MYNKTNWVSGQTEVSADNLNKMEEGIYQNSLILENNNTEHKNSIVNGELHLTTNRYQVVTMEDNTTIVLPTVESFTEIHLFFDTTSALTLIFPEIKWQNQPSIEANCSYEFIFTYVNNAWLGGYIVRK